MLISQKSLKLHMKTDVPSESCTIFQHEVILLTALFYEMVKDCMSLRKKKSLDSLYTDASFKDFRHAFLGGILKPHPGMAGPTPRCAMELCLDSMELHKSL